MASQTLSPNLTSTPSSTLLTLTSSSRSSPPPFLPPPPRTSNRPQPTPSSSPIPSSLQPTFLSISSTTLSKQLSLKLPILQATFSTPSSPPLPTFSPPSLLLPRWFSKRLESFLSIERERDCEGVGWKGSGRAESVWEGEGRGGEGEGEGLEEGWEGGGGGEREGDGGRIWVGEGGEKWVVGWVGLKVGKKGRGDDAEPQRRDSVLRT